MGWNSEFAGSSTTRFGPSNQIAAAEPNPEPNVVVDVTLNQVPLPGHILKHLDSRLHRESA